MRIVAGIHKGRAIAAPDGKATRPTSDRARETVFNVLAHGVDGANLDGARVVDVFAGTGALGLEAISRGAGFCIFIETARAAIAALKNNISTLGEDEATAVIGNPVEKAPPPPGGPVDIAFLDAPYDKGLTNLALERMVLKDWFKPESIVVIEVGRDEEFNPPPEFEILKEKTVGAARTVFMKFNKK
ncbi:MAG: 16S rRNA (guanine(966)-N(2))-methyltransferase RsmD [Rhodospirillaceae bacterium]|nr:16S rRNA (guanine(966)-N(2))-methyltransferase RsmD [Rhodospirillaceae bacterium]